MSERDLTKRAAMFARIRMLEADAHFYARRGQHNLASACFFVARYMIRSIGGAMTSYEQVWSGDISELHRGQLLVPAEVPTPAPVIHAYHGQRTGAKRAPFGSQADRLRAVLRLHPRSTLHELATHLQVSPQTVTGSMS